MINWKFGVSIGWGLVAVALALTALSCSDARAEDFCNTRDLCVANPDWCPLGGEELNLSQFEAGVRKKCKIGGIIYFNVTEDIARLCDLHKPVISVGSDGGVCFLAPPRKTY
jgi:hypothetical protein